MEKVIFYLKGGQTIKTKIRSEDIKSINDAWGECVAFAMLSKTNEGVTNQEVPNNNFLTLCGHLSVNLFDVSAIEIK